MPVKTNTLVITSPFGIRTLNGKTAMHRGVDLRSVSMSTGKDLQIIAPEQCEVLRQGKDTFGNYFLVVKPLQSNYDELKFIHISETHFSVGEILNEDDYIGVAIIGGNSKAKHLHFETWRHGKPFNPVEYFNYKNIQYKLK